MKSPEQYQPSAKEIEKAEEMMDNYEKRKSYEREENYLSLGQQGNISDIKVELKAWDTGMRIAALDHYFVMVNNLYAKVERNIPMQKIIEDIGETIKKNLTSQSLIWKEISEIYPVKHQDALSKIKNQYIMDENHAVLWMYGEWEASPQKGKSSRHNMFYQVNREENEISMKRILSDLDIVSVDFDDKDKKMEIMWKKHDYIEPPMLAYIPNESNIDLQKTTIDKDGNSSTATVKRIQKAYDKYYRKKYGEDYEEKYEQKRQRQEQMYERAKNVLGNKYDEGMIGRIVLYLSPKEESLFKQNLNELEQALEKEQSDKEKDKIKEEWLQENDPQKHGG